MAKKSIRSAEQFLSFREQVTEMRRVFSFILSYRITYDPFCGNKKKMFSSVVSLRCVRSGKRKISVVAKKRTAP